MNWLDIVLIVVIIGISIFEMFRGFGRAVFDAIFLYGALFLAALTTPPAAAALHLAEDPGSNTAYIYAILLVLFAVLALLFSRFVYGLTLFDAGMFESFLGLVAGVGVGVMLAHGIVRTINLTDPSVDTVAVVANGAVANEMLNFTTFHRNMDTITGVTSYRSELPDVANAKQ